MKYYLFYDIETTGLNKAFDQVLQFAAIRTDPALNEIDRTTLMVKVRPDVVPAPGAVITHRISPNAADKGVCEYEAISRIHALMNAPQTVSVGYNTLGFDDEFLRFCFHRNLFPPYTHQYAGGCGRMDLLPMAAIYRLHKPEVLDWPEVDGSPTLRLEHLSAANTLAQGPAHDALVDVEATVALAKRFMAERPTWEYLLAAFDKQTDRERAEKIPSLFQSPAGIHRMGLMVGARYGAAKNYQIPVLSIGNSLPYSNQSLWLRLDQPELCQTTEESIAESTWVVRKRFGEPGILLPPSERFWRLVDEERAKVVDDNIRWIKSNDRLFQKIIRHHVEFAYPLIPDLDSDAALYQNGFLNRKEEAACRAFHGADPMGKVTLAEKMPSEKTKVLAERILWRNWPENLPAPMAQAFSRYLERVNPAEADGAMVDYRGEKRNTPVSALAEIEALVGAADAGLDLQQRQLLDELTGHIRGKFSG